MKKEKHTLRYVLLLAAVLVTVGMCSGCAAQSAEEQQDRKEQQKQEQEQNQEQEPNRQEEPITALAGCLEGTSLDGSPVTGEVLQNASLTLINFWATDCPPCVRELPGLGSLAKAYEDKDVQIIGVCFGTLSTPADRMDETRLGELTEEAQSLVTQSGADYLQMLPNSRFVNEYILPNTSAFPFTVLTDARGNLLGSYIGARAEEDWASILDEALETLG